MCDASTDDVYDEIKDILNGYFAKTKCIYR